MIVQGLTYFEALESRVLGWMVAVLAAITAACLLIGFLTPIVSTVTCFSAVVLAASGLPFATFSVVGLVVLAAVIALLGPGAFSLDSWLFGRREILIPHTTRDMRHFRDS